ncbi:tandem-95 repeat protein [Novipirellula artificiosorum]|uniref:tandem-95 repeat protein n=1 Tax=Novipirellula artificiosorum TaxID=2528016 RepID=UPI001E369B9A|nr:tandem-95 repeat protein [Novipirellula artificiosorum]
MRRQHLLETLEARQLLAGPQLIGIQPNEGDLIVDGSVRESAPRVLTFRFDQDQQIDANTLDGIRITRSGQDDVFNTADDVRITPGLVTLGDPNQNEVVVRFAESLPDDNYRIEVFGYDDAGLGVTGIRNIDGELLQPRTAGQRSEVVNFDLRLGALVEAVVPQPVIRKADGSLEQNRNEIVVYFNEDELFVENDDTGQPTDRSAENPRFYQLLFTQETARTTDDLLYHPEKVVYDPATHTARLFFADDLNDLPGVPTKGGTWRLRVGSAVDDRIDLIIQPTRTDLNSAAAGDTLGTAFDVGTFGLDPGLTSLVYSESIEAQPYAIELPGGNDDPGHPEFDEIAGSLQQHINDAFGPDVQDGITEISYNFNDIFDTNNAGASFLNQITERQKTRVREALELWAAKIGVQFRETVDEGITFAFGNPANLQFKSGTTLVSQTVLSARLRIDPTFDQPAMVFSNDANYSTAYGEDFLRKAAAGIGLILGLETTPDLPAQTLMSLNSGYLNASIDSLGDLEPVFPGSFDVLHGQYVHRPDSIDVDLYRFEVDFNDADKVGTLTAETFAERLADSSMLDTTLTLFQEVKASLSTNFGIDGTLNVRFDSLLDGRLSNCEKIHFVQSDRAAGDTAVKVNRMLDAAGNELPNAVELDLPRAGSVSAQAIIDAINGDAFASSILRATLVGGDGATDVSENILNFSPLELKGGGLYQLTRNDDYFSEDSRISYSLGEGIYYIGVAASGNDHYDPTISESGYGGLSQGEYELNVKFEPQVDERDVIRDLDSEREGVPGSILDGDGDGIAGGNHNFWFQTRPLDRTLEFIGNGDAVTAGQTVQITSAQDLRETRTYEFVPFGGAAKAGNTPVFFNTGTAGFPTPASTLVASLQTAINQAADETGVIATANGTLLVLTGNPSLTLSANSSGIEVFGRNIFVDKTAEVRADGSLDKPFNNIANPNVPNAFDVALPGDIVRIIGNGGVDRDLSTEADNYSYQIGIPDVGGGMYADGPAMEVPKGVTTMIDAGAAFKLRSSYIGVGSSTVQVDRSNGSLQVLGTPRLVELSETSDVVPAGRPTPTLLAQENVGQGGYDDGSVIFTSFFDRAVDSNAAGDTPAADKGDWGGIRLRRDIDQFEGRKHLEDEAIFLNSINHAEIRYGGTRDLLIDSVQQLANPIDIYDLRPAISFTEISNSADAAISALPNSFAESNYQAPRYQASGVFTPDYDRVGPDIHHNQLYDNSINGLFVRVVTTPTESPKALTVAGHFDDTDIVHYIAENIIIQGTPGGSLEDGFSPDMSLVNAGQLTGGSLDLGSYNYVMTFVDADGFESLASTSSFTFDVSEDGSSINLTGLPQVQDGSAYRTRRLYRQETAGGPFFLVTDLNGTGSRFIDRGTKTDGVLDTNHEGRRGRLDASLTVDPGTVVKLRGSRIEVGFGAQLLAEGTESHPIIFTSVFDDRYGAGGTFDSNNDADSAGGGADHTYGDWGGLYGSPTSTISLDYATVAHGGGVTLLTGGQTRGFAALELHQANGRITHSRFEANEDGQDGAGPVGRFGLLGVTPSTIFVRGAQPIIVGNDFIDNRGSIIDIDSESLTADRLIDAGRQTGENERLAVLDDNYGPMVRFNRYEDNATEDNASLRQISGMEIRGGTLTTESVWDDTDIVHVLFDSVTVENFHSSGGLRLMSRLDESLVVKMLGEASPHNPYQGTGLTATGSLSDISDRIGGSIHILGQPGHPVVLTSFLDDTAGAGLQPNGAPFTDTNGDGIRSRPEENDWRSVFMDQFSNDRNVSAVLELELSTELAPGLNGDLETAQHLGDLASGPYASDDVRRLGFEVEGYIGGRDDIDTYSFIGTPGTEIWVDVDRTTYTLDTVIEVLDETGRVLARSDNSFDEISGNSDVLVLDSALAQTTTSLQTGPDAFTQLGAGGLYEDFGSTNPRDAGIHFALPGSTADSTARSPYFIRIRSNSHNPDEANCGLTSGGYRFQLRLQEEQEFAGSVVRYADIRYANHGIHTRGLPSSSPLLGEAQENEGVSDAISSNDSLTTSITVPGNRAQYLGNLLNSENKVFSVGGALSSAGDVDFYQIDVDRLSGLDSQTTTVFDIDYADGFNRPDTTLYVYYDPDGEDGPIQPTLVLTGDDSSILDDQSSPLTSMPDDLLSRGSVAEGDAFIGPISLSGGSYYVAVVNDGAIADALRNPTTRREPLESVLRIFEDHVSSIGGSTALPPREGAFIDQTTLNPGWSVTTVRATDPGHGINETFNGSRTSALFPPSNQAEIEFNNAFLTAQDLSAGDPEWSLANDANIGDENFGTFNPSTNTSQAIPHTSVFGTTVNEIVDIYRFDVSQDNSRVILDIDNGAIPTFFDPDNLPADFPDFDDTLNASGVDLKMQLFDAAFNQVGVTSFFSEVLDGQLGSFPQFVFGNVTSFFTEDPFIEQDALAAGTYYVAVSPEATTYDPATLSFDLAVDQRPATGTYTLHVSVENHPNDGGDPSNESIRFDRSAAGGTLESAAFDLSGYGPSDQPKFYFSYFYDPGAGDSVEIRARSNENPAGEILDDAAINSTIVGNAWNQGVASLSDFAGHTGVVIEFEYTTGTGTGEGLFLDDFIVGFAERGEMITGAPVGSVGIIGATGAGQPTGEYQLEVRPGTSYATSSRFGGLTLDTTFDTNVRQTESVTIVAPHADQITDGDTFVLSDGIKQVTLEFDLDASVTPGNVRIAYTATSSQSQVADAIRSAINSQTVQSTLKIQASDSSGSATGGYDDVKVSLTGNVIGDFLALDDPADLPDSGMPLVPTGEPFQLPVVYSQGIGDENYERYQSQVVVEHNIISHARAIGIYSEAGVRGFDPEDLQNNFFFTSDNPVLNPENLFTRFNGLDPAPIGNAYPGAVRNFPTLNDDVIGGQMPGIVVRNNIVDQAGFAGIKVEGQMRPYVIDSSTYDLNAVLFGDLIADGLTMIIDAADTRVVFEFEELAGAPVAAGGSGVQGGNGWVDGHVPIYYRRTVANTYNGGGDASTRYETMLAIYDAINSSILVTNGLDPLVKATLATSLQGSNDNFFGNLFGNTSTSVYVEGATNILFSSLFANVGLNPFIGQTGLAAVHEAPQPVSKIVNNTVYGEDGTQSRFPGSATAEPNDVLLQAVETYVGNAHTGAFVTAAQIGDNSAVTAAADVDMYRVFLGAGDRLTVDIDSLVEDVDNDITGGPDTVLRLFDSRGIEIAFVDSATAPDYLELAATTPEFLIDPATGNFVLDANGNRIVANAADPFLDFTARTEGTYYVAVSSAGHEDYDALTVADRVDGTGGSGEYNIAIKAYAPRSFVLTIDNINNREGFDAAALIGTTFTITQIPDRLETANNPTNVQTFEFTNAAGGLRVNGNVNIPLRDGEQYRVPDIATAIADAISGVNFADNQGLPNPPLPNHEFGNGPDDVTGPIARVTARALGGQDGYNGGLQFFLGGADNNTVFGHNRTNAQVNSSPVAGSSSRGDGVSELYVLVERAAEITISPEAAAAGLRLDPAAGLNIDQLLPETGVLLTGGSSGTVLNNVFSNLHQGVVNEITKTGGFSSGAADQHPKPGATIVTGNTFQHIETANNVFRLQMSSPFGNIGITPSPSNVNGGTDDFNQTLGNNDALFVNPTAGNFLPAPGAAVIDSAVNAITDRPTFVDVKESVGISQSNVVAPARDAYGVLRADHPLYAPAHAVGETIFKDRGAVELADFVGPVAILEVPRDNDALVIDADGATAFVTFEDEVYKEFRIQLRDNGDKSDPFLGHGIDDNSVVVPEGPGPRMNGSNITVFENDKLLQERIDYTFHYDPNKNIIVLTPLAGIWKNDRSYRIAVNGLDRSVLIAPSASQVSDGDQITITDANGGNIVFEFETGYQLAVPETISLTVPFEGTNEGGIRDGAIFQLSDGKNPTNVFEFNLPGDAKLPGSVQILIPAGPTPVEPDELDAFLTTIAQNTQNAIDSQVAAGKLDVDTRLDGYTVIVGAETGATVNTRGSGLVQDIRTLALRVPAAGAGFGGVVDGDSFTINDGTETVTFEFDNAGGLNDPTNQAISISGNPTASQLALLIQQSIANRMRLDPLLYGNTVYLNLPVEGSAIVPTGQLSLVGLSRTPADGDLLTLTPNDGSAPVVVEINRTDEPDDVLGGTKDDGVTTGHTAINITRLTTALELGQAIANTITSDQIGTIAGLNKNAVSVDESGLVSIGGMAGLGLNTTGVALEVTGEPSVAGSSRIEVFGPLLLQLPLVGGGGFTDGSVLILKDDLGNDVVFEFNVSGTAQSVAGATPVTFNTFDTVDVLADTLVTAINASTANIVSSNTGSGRVSLGRISESRVVLTGIPGDPIDPTDDVPGVPQISTRRGIVADGEILTIRQGNESVSFEFESISNGGGVQAGNVAIPFSPTSSTGDIAVSLAAAINNNKGNLQISASAAVDAAGVATGVVNIDDVPGTVIDSSQAPTLNVLGVPGGAQPIFITPSSSDEDVKRALITAINSDSVAAFTDLHAVDRGGSTFFVENASDFNGPISTYYLPGVKDVDGNPLEANRQDESSQFTILMPSVGMDYGDAADPIGGVAGRYPTTLNHDGPRHVVGGGVMLGTSVDVDSDGRPSNLADGDNAALVVTSTGTLFNVTMADGVATIEVAAGVSPGTRDGDTIVINTGYSTATLEFDINGRFDEDHYEIKSSVTDTPAMVAAAIGRAIAESPLRPAMVTVEGSTVTVSGNDEDGVSFVSDNNPEGILNSGVGTVVSVTQPDGSVAQELRYPVTVTVSGGGFVDGWIDFGADGDFDDPGDQILFSERFDAAAGPVEKTFFVKYPENPWNVLDPAMTYARFRVSNTGGLTPTGMALSGEVEDYALRLLPGLPPTVSSTQANRQFVGSEDQTLQVLDVNGTLTPSITNDNGLLTDITDPDNDVPLIYADDVGTRTLVTAEGVTAGTLTLNSDGTFSFNPVADFSGNAIFTARVTDGELISSRTITATITLNPINDPPVANTADVIISQTINEDAVTTLDRDVLITPFYSPGPANESSQPMIIQSAGSIRGPFLSSLGGTISIIDNGVRLVYTPPADYNGTVADTFTYSVADVPGTGQSPQTAAKMGTVSFSFLSVNDAPRLINDSYVGEEDTELSIPVSNVAGTGVLDNDAPGPADEVAAGQTIGLVTSVFPQNTFRGGTVRLSNGNLLYNPPAEFSGVDQFSYTVQDDAGLTSSATVIVNVGGENDGPIFIGINGDPNEDSLEFEEAKADPKKIQYDLSTWFEDPENDDMTYAATSTNTSIVAASVVGDTLVLDLPPYAYGMATLNITATDANGVATVESIDVNVVDTSDPPRIVGTLDPLTTAEDVDVVSDLTTVFADPDGEPLTYSVTSLGGILNPTAAQIAASDLIESIAFEGNEMRIHVKPDQSGKVDLEIAATDGDFRISDNFELTITAVADAPIAADDAYNVPVGATLQILNPASGLLRNDRDADGDAITVDVSSVTPADSNFTVNPDGTFVYKATSGSVGSQVSYTYSVVDATTSRSNTATVTFTLNQSRYQNPIDDLASDVNADGRITAIDALRVINLLSSPQMSGQSSLSVSAIGTPPPDFVDVSGDGMVSAYDALLVINALEALPSTPSGQGEWATTEAVNLTAGSASTVSYASISQANLPVRNAIAVEEETVQSVAENVTDPRDAILGAGFEIGNASLEAVADAVVSANNETGPTADSSSVDAALASLLDDNLLDL